MLSNVKDKNGKILLAALAGASAGIIAGLLMAPEAGQSTRSNLKKTVKGYGDQIDQLFRSLLDRLEGNNVTPAGSSLQMQGTWDEVKGRLRTRYGSLTDDDLEYVEGQEDHFLGNLEFKLGKGKKELRRIIEEI